VVRQLQVLQRQLAAVPRLRDALEEACAGGNRRATQHAAAQADRHIRDMALTTAHLRVHVVGADDLGVALESLSELALRAARLVVFTDLEVLRALARASPGAAYLVPVSSGRSWGIKDMTVCVHAVIDHITASWRAYCGQAQTERPAYRAALHAAHAAMWQLGTTSEFARFLWQGRQRFDQPQLQAACDRMSIALTCRIDIEPDGALVAYEPRSTARATEHAS
jgi:hypothetical protein